MAAPVRPSISIDATTIIYQSLDVVDQNTYNGLETLYEKMAFIAAIQDRLVEIASGGW
jgi:hypothetical protein